MNKLNFIKKWDVIDLLELIKEISNDNNKHPVEREFEYILLEKSRGNDSANLAFIADDDKTPIINEYLLDCGFVKGDKVLYWISY